ncbi:hypothetical protein ACFO5R_02685 [Halosolutus amylolyticus]|uniref:ATP-binding protein n=1 Tax=Halosolutus amylolyticus TaxID=2932267 RepID=A0ABD5PK96_9EURY|nr:ATP-binding protein [Halosolutus amylolyticus]
MADPVPYRTVGAVPTDLDTIADVFQNHYSYYQSLDGEVAHQQQTGETQIRREYSGRVVFELLQNALDRADETVVVRLAESSRDDGAYELLVANDGDGIRVDPSYDYENPPDAGGSDRRRPDFNALCSLHTSNKSPDESIGTKGIGFRSVFALGTHVRVWSNLDTTSDSAWWGLEMHSPLDQTTWINRSETPAVDRGQDRFLNGTVPRLDDAEPRPSYHFPLPLYTDTQPEPVENAKELSTAIVVPIPEAQYSTLRDRVAEFKSHHLHFVGLDPDRRDITVSFETPSDDPPSFQRTTWPSTVTSEITPQRRTIAAYTSSALAGDAEKADHDVKEPGAAIAWPPTPTRGGDGTGSDNDTSASIYGYLPTLIDAPFGVDIHGDFQLSIDRTNIRLDDDQMGPYNRKLLEIAAELHLLRVIRTVDADLEHAIEWTWIQPSTVTETTPAATSQQRRDFWQFLNPTQGDSDAAAHVISHLKTLLFPGGSKDTETYTHWATLADAYFEAQDEWPIETFEQFWAASIAWIDQLCSTKYRRKNWRRTALALCNALREHHATVAPVILTNESNETDSSTAVSAVPLPDRADSDHPTGHQQRHDRKLFLQSTDASSLTLPTALTADDRAVTTFDFASDLYSQSPNALNTTPFNRWEVLRELRQLPNASVANWSGSPLAGTTDEAVARQQELISFAAELYLLDTGTSHDTPTSLTQNGPGWRALPAPSDAARRAGRAIATLYLPTTDEKWAPARQLTQADVDEDRLGELPEELSLDDFLTFLGVAPAPPHEDAPAITLVEGGSENGVVPRRDAPPALTAPGPGTRDLTLGELPLDHSTDTPESWYDAITAAEPWLQPLLDAEHDATQTGEENAEDDDVIPDRIDLLDPLGERAWYPVDDTTRVYASPPATTENVTGVPPRDLTLLSAYQPYLAELLWSVDQAAVNDELLITLGAIDGTAREDLAAANAAPAVRLLTQLRTHTDPTAFADTPSIRDAYTSLFERILDAIVRNGPSQPTSDDLAVLTYRPAGEQRALSTRRLEWRSLDDLAADPAWVAASPADQETMRRCFPDERLVSATIGPELLDDYQPLSDYGVTIEQTVQFDAFDEPDHDPDVAGEDVASTIADELAEIVPSLLALADADQHLTVNLTDDVEQWSPNIFTPVANVWLEYTATFGTETTRTTTKHKNDDGIALLNADSANGEEPVTRRIIFDVTSDGSRPPLAAFGRPLAELLLEDHHSQAASLFERALQTYETDPEDLDQLLDRRDATPLVETYEHRINPLDTDQRDVLLTKTEQALNTFNIELQTTAVTRLRTLTPADLQPTPETPRDLSEATINEEFGQIELSTQQEPFRPAVHCRTENQRRWNEWFDTYQEHLVPYLLDLLQSTVLEDIEEDTLTDRLHEYITTTELQQLQFHPDAAVQHWLTKEGVPDADIPDDLIEEARQFIPEYKRVTTVTNATDIDSSWSRHSLSDPEPSMRETGTVDQSDVFDRMRSQKTVGTNAEHAALETITEQTHNILDETRDQSTVETIHGPVQDAWDVLYWPIPDGGVTASNLTSAQQTYEETRNRDDLKAGLHLANVWDGAGYDLLGLERDSENRVQPVRYEIKAISATRPVVGLHLTSKQLAVYETVRDDENDDLRYAGDWQLWGVEDDGTATEFTDTLDELPNDALDKLRTEGFEHDGLILRVTRTEPTD